MTALELRLLSLVRELRDDLVKALPNLGKPGYELDVGEIIASLDAALGE